MSAIERAIPFIKCDRPHLTADCNECQRLKEAARTELADLQSRPTKEDLEANVMSERATWQARESEGYRQVLMDRVIKAENELAGYTEIGPIKQLAEKWLGWAGKPTQEAQGCGNTDDERNEAANDAYREAANSLLTLIDKPGGR